MCGSAPYLSLMTSTTQRPSSVLQGEEEGGNRGWTIAQLDSERETHTQTQTHTHTHTHTQTHTHTDTHTQTLSRSPLQVVASHCGHTSPVHIQPQFLVLCSTTEQTQSRHLLTPLLPTCDHVHTHTHCWQDLNRPTYLHCFDQRSLD